jgi:hypothetical protein
MRPLWEWMQDKRVAGALAGVAILFVGYRLIGSGTGSAPPVPQTAVAPSPSPDAQAPVRASVDRSSLPAASTLPIPPGWTGPTWSWNRNPFLGPAGERPVAGGAAGKRNGDAAQAAREEGEVPELRGTIVSGTVSLAILRSHRQDGGNRLVPVGGKIGDWTLSGVEPYRVSLRRGKETRVLELYKQ